MYYFNIFILKVYYKVFRDEFVSLESIRRDGIVYFEVAIGCPSFL